jgi:hypothetical protein
MEARELPFVLSPKENRRRGPVLFKTGRGWYETF